MKDKKLQESRNQRKDIWLKSNLADTAKKAAKSVEKLSKTLSNLDKIKEPNPKDKVIISQPEDKKNDCPLLCQQCKYMKSFSEKGFFCEKHYKGELSIILNHFDGCGYWEQKIAFTTNVALDSSPSIVSDTKVLKYEPIQQRHD
jgi:hypothetical protein